MDRRSTTISKDGELSAAEAAALRQKVLDQEALIEEQATSLKRRSARIRQLEELLKSLRQSQYGASSEKLSPDQLGLFNEAEETVEVEEPVETEVRSHTRRSRGRSALPEDLPREEIIYDLEDAEKRCPHDGADLEVIGQETSEQLEIIPATVKVLRHVRLKYACPCCEAHVVTASKPKQLLGKSIAAPGLLAYVATAKYQDALPLYRQSAIFQRLGVELDRTTLANWMIRCGEAIEPLINRLTEHILSLPLVQMDETPVQVLKEPGKTAESKSYMWVLGAGPPDQRSVIFRYDASRSGSVPKDMLGDYQGALMVDGYEGYGAVCNDSGLLRLGCWAHARRKFVAAKKIQPKGKAGRADQALAHIQKLYAIERHTKEMSPEERHAYRNEHARPILEKLSAWVEKTMPRVPPKSAMGKALHYLHQQWPRLVAYLENGAYPIDNNRIENAIRPFAIGRKNWLFANSQAGARASANLYSLIESAKGHGLEPYRYLRHVFTALPNARGDGDIAALLPHNVEDGVL
jgi:transposase